MTRDRIRIVALVLMIALIIVWAIWAIAENVDIDFDPFTDAQAADKADIYLPLVFQTKTIINPRPTPTPYIPLPTPAPTMDPGETWYIAPPGTTNVDLFSPIVLQGDPDVFSAYELKPCDFCAPTVYFHAFVYQGDIVWGFPEDRSCRMC